MANLVLNDEEIQNTIARFNVAIDNLNKAIYYSGSLNIPDEFEYKQYLKQLNGKNISSRDSILSKKQILEQSVSRYKKVEKENYNNFSEISILNVTNRNSF